MFDDAHYVPILRSKTAEFDALAQLAPPDRRLIIPMLDILPKVVLDVRTSTPPNITPGLAKVAKRISTSWGGYPVFIDLGRIEAAGLGAGGVPPLLSFWQLVRAHDPMFPELGPLLIPVTSLDRGAAYEQAVSAMVQQENHGLCLRLTADDVKRGTVWAEVDRFLTRLGCTPPDVHLVVDLALIAEEAMPNIPLLCARIPHLHLWQTFTVAAGSFPRDLTHLKPIGEYEVPRIEWRMWREQMIANPQLPRRANFGDYGIYHPIYVEAPRGVKPSASIRYAGIDHWVIMRGRQVAQGGSQQYPAQALALRERPEFLDFGPTYSAGDTYINQMADAYVAAPNNVQRTGNATTWLQAGFNRHVTLTARKAAALYATVLDENAILAA